MEFEGETSMRRIAAVLAVLVGITLIAFTFAEHLFTRSSDAQTISDHYRPLMSTAGLNDLSRGFNAVKAAGGQLDTAAEPQLQAALGMDAQAFAAYKSREMPGIAQFDAQAPGVVTLVGPVIGQMQAERADYARASDIPISWLPLSSAPWLFLGIGALLLAVGAFALIRPSLPATTALLVVGLGVALAPLVIGIPAKVDAAVRVTKIGRVGLAPTTAAKAVGATKLFDGMVDDVQTKLQPAIEQQMGAGSFAKKFPTLAQFSNEWQRTTSAKSHALSDSQVALGPTFTNADSIPLRPIPWLFILPGIALALIAGAGLAMSARRNPADASLPAGSRALPTT
jgi:hypothetical protein